MSLPSSGEFADDCVVGASVCGVNGNNCILTLNLFFDVPFDAFGLAALGIPGPQTTEVLERSPKQWIPVCMTVIY